MTSKKEIFITGLDDFNDLAVEIGVKLVTILVPLPSAVSLFNAMLPEVGWFGALIMATVIELFGLAAIDNNYLLWTHKDKVDPRISYYVTFGYMIVSEAVIYAFKVYNHNATNYVYMLFPLLSIMGFILLMNRKTVTSAIEREAFDLNEQNENRTGQFERQVEQLSDQLSNAQSEIRRLKIGHQTISENHSLTLEKRDSEIERLNAELSDFRVRFAELNGEYRALSAVRSERKPNGSERSKMSKADAIEAMINMYKSNPDASLTDAARLTGKGKSTVSGYLKELEASERVYVNGNVKVL